MTTIQIAHEVSDRVVSRIEDMLSEQSVCNPDFEGLVFEIERGDVTCIADDDSMEAVNLLYKIQDIIEEG